MAIDVLLVRGTARGSGHHADGRTSV